MFFVFFVFGNLLFPFITSKQLSFNILMELLIAVWLVFVWRYPAYRPQRSLVTWGLIAYLAAILLSLARSYDPGLSFWGDAERMMGLFHVTHFFFFYLILITAFRNWREWQALLIASVVAAVGVAVKGVFGANVYSTIGNTTYVSGYLIFNLYFAFLLFRRSASPWRWLYLPAAAIMLWEFALAKTSGAIIGLALAVLLFVFLLGLLHEDNRRRRLSLIAFLVAALAILAIFSQSHQAWFQNSFLQRLTFQKATFQTRLISWRGAVADFGSHWLLGVGFGNYAVVFDRHFDPKFYDYALTETYFDRAHNNLIDIASTTGVVGLIAYLSIFAAAGYYLVRRFREGGKRIGPDNYETIVLTSLLAAYFIQNLAVFDSYVTYTGLMMTLGYLHWLVFIEGKEEAAERAGRFSLGRNGERIALVVFLLIAYLFAYQFNIKPWKMFKGVIDGYSLVLEGKLAQGIVAYQEALTGTPLDQDGRTTLVNLVASNPSQLQSFTPEQAELILQYVITLAQQNVEKNPADSLSQMQLAQIYDTAARYFYKDPDKFMAYSNLALEAIEKSIAASPGRPPVYLAKAQMQLSRGESEAAIATVRYAISLNPHYYEGHCRLAQFYFFLEQADADNAAKYVAAEKEPLDNCIDHGGAANVSSQTFLAQVFNYYAGENDYARSLLIAERMVQLNAYDAQSWLNLAKLYSLASRPDDAEYAASQAQRLNPDMAAKWQRFLDDSVIDKKE